MYKVYEMMYAGRKLILETGKLAQQAGASVLVRCGDTAVLVCATMSEKPREGVDFFPLSVDYEEKLYAVGKIPGGYIKREGRASEKAILTSRLIDRPLRPLFPKGMYNDVQIVATALSVEVDIQPDVYAMIGASLALSISDIPFEGPIGAVVVGQVNGRFVLNPDFSQKEASTMYVTVAGTKDAIMMVEAGCNEVDEDTMVDAILYGHEEIKRVVAFLEEITKEIGKPKREIALKLPSGTLTQAVTDYAFEKMQWALDTIDREERQKRCALVEEEVQAYFAGKYEEDVSGDIAEILYSIEKNIVRDKIINQHMRPDGRKFDEIRPIWCEHGVFARTHGSAVFTRGQTQVMTIATLGAMGDMQILDGISDEDCKRYMHHYNMPPYSVGETRPIRGPGRREIGHGALAERALLPMLPSEESFPYAIRLVSEAISSNGSTSMASVCASTLALMDGGVPIKAPVAGVAMGLIKEGEKVAVLTDIQGLEDFLGDMDFKVAGSKAGITAIQMDIKIKGIDEPILRRALEQARQGRLFILEKMLEVLPEPEKSLSPYAPKIISFEINPDKIREVIGSGGKVINKIIADTGVKIDLEDDGRVFITTPDEKAAERARTMIEAIAADVKIGQVFLGKVVRIMNFGAFVELAPGKDGMVHISKLADKRVEKVEDVVNLGDEIWVKVIEIDEKGRINLTHRGVTGPQE